MVSLCVSAQTFLNMQKTGLIKIWLHVKLISIINCQLAVIHKTGVANKSAKNFTLKFQAVAKETLFVTPCMLYNNHHNCCMLNTSHRRSLTLSLPIFWLPVPGKHIYVREIKLQPLTFVNTAIISANSTEGILSTLVANGTGTVWTIVATSSERVNNEDTIRTPNNKIPRHGLRFPVLFHNNKTNVQLYIYTYYKKVRS